MEKYCSIVVLPNPHMSFISNLAFLNVLVMSCFLWSGWADRKRWRKGTTEKERGETPCLQNKLWKSIKKNKKILKWFTHPIDFSFKSFFLLDYKEQYASGNIAKLLASCTNPIADVHFLTADETNVSLWIGFLIKQTLASEICD